MEIKSWLKKNVVGMVKNRYGHSGLRALKLAVSQKGINGINWFLGCWSNFRKAKSYFNNFWMVVIKKGCGLLGIGTLKSALSQEWTDESGWFFAWWYKFMKARSYFNNYWVGVGKNGRGLKDHGTLKLGLSHKWFDELSRLIEWFLYADSDGILLFCLKWCPILAAWKLYVWEICFSSYSPKCSSKIRLQDFLNFHISKTISGIMFFFCMLLDIHGIFS